MTSGVCPNCAALLPDGARFCPSCGAQALSTGDERRIVTVLFADVVGFTPLSEARDPEHVKNLLDRCFERLVADVSAYGGRVDKIVGDEIMAIFGAPVAHEDDPERAVRAALQMHKNLEQHATETGADVRTRIGVNTGEVLVGSLRAGGDVTALGDVVNIAKRLQTAAEPGQVLVGSRTHEATSDVIRYESVGALTVKGRDAPVEAWSAVEPLGPPGTRPGRARRALVGRQSEVALLWHALSTAVDNERPHFVLLVGEAGMGKTVLVEEAMEIARVQHDALVIEGRCLPYGEANPWWPIAEVLRQACDIETEDPADIAAQKCRQAVADLIGPEGEGSESSRVAEGLLYLMGYEGSLPDLEPSRARDEAMRSIQLALGATAKERPLVVVLSEIHWADQLVLDVIDAMLERLKGLPIVLIATARPELEERWSPHPGRYNLFVVHLDPLDDRESAKFVRELMGESAPDELVELVVERSGGNPLFISELVAVMGEADKAFVPGFQQQRAHLPATLRGLVAARLDGLDRADRAVLEDASVIGRTGPIDALVALAKARGEPEGVARFATLVHRDFMLQIDGSFEFRSDLVRDVSYQTLTKADRARRHAATADWLASYAQRTEREDEHLERIAHHYAQAAALAREVGLADELTADVHSRALEWLDRAAARAEARETTAVSVHLLEHALELVSPDEPELRSRFLLSRARGRAGLRDMEGAHADAEEALRMADRIGSRALCARALTVRGDIEQREGDLLASAATLEEAVKVWREVGDRTGEAEALRSWGFTSIHRGELDAAERAISEALDISVELGDRRGEAWAVQNLAWAAFSRGDNRLAEQRLQASAKLFEEIGDFGGQSWALGLLGYVWYSQGRLDDAATVAESGLEWTREMGDRWAYGMMLNLVAAVRLWQGRTEESMERSGQALKLFEEIDEKMGRVFAGIGVAWCAVLTGHSKTGLEMSLRLIPESDKVFAGGLAGIMTAATLHVLVGDWQQAQSLLDERPAISDEPVVLAARALTALVAGRPEEAYDHARRAWDSDPSDPGERANFACVLGLAAAATGQASEAVSAGEEVGRAGGSYLDQTRAHLARAFGHSQLGETTQAAAALSSARRLIDGTQDQLHRALVRLAEAVSISVGGDELASQASPVEDVRRRLEELGVIWRPWERAFRLAATGGTNGTPVDVE